MKYCPSNKILNPKTNRCVKKGGKIGKTLFVFNELKWINNSCYIDSLLIAFRYSFPNIFKESELNLDNGERLVKYQIKIKNELENIIDGLNDNCNKIRKLFNIYYNELIKINPKIDILNGNENFIYSQLDIFQVIELFHYIFKFKKDLIIYDNNYINNTSFDINISIDMLINKNLIKIRDLYPKHKYKIFVDNKKYIKRYEILKAKYLMIKIYRNLGFSKLKTKIIVSSYLKLKDNKLELKSIIIHYGSNNGGHYITLFKYYNNWYEFNDMSKISIINKGLSEINKNDNYTSNIVALLYS